MNIDLARTFLEVVETGNFAKAAERLSVTQSTVSMRIKALEDEIGRPLFVRSKTGTGLSPAGLRFRRYATMLVRVWEQARHEIALPPGLSAVLTIGGHFALWDRLLVQWIPWMRTALPEVAVHAEVGSSTDLMRNLSEGMIDIGVMYAPNPRPGLIFEKLLEERLVMVSTVKRSLAELDQDYVYVDWGADFKQMHSQSFPDQKAPAISVGLGALGLQHILANGGTGYFPMRVIRGFLAAGRLHQVTDAPDFRHPAWVVYTQDSEREDWFLTALDGLRYVASLESED